VRIARERAMRRYRDKQTIEHLAEFEYVRIQGERLYITEKGKSALGELVEATRKTLEERSWDGKWRIIIFDIPATSNTIRDIFRRKLKEFGFYRLQKSIWVFPFECREEIQLLRDFLEVGQKQIIYIEAMDIEGDGTLRKYFGL